METRRIRKRQGALQMLDKSGTWVPLAIDRGDLLLIMTNGDVLYVPLASEPKSFQGEAIHLRLKTEFRQVSAAGLLMKPHQVNVTVQGNQVLVDGVPFDGGDVGVAARVVQPPGLRMLGLMRSLVRQLGAEWTAPKYKWDGNSGRFILTRSLKDGKGRIRVEESSTAQLWRFEIVVANGADINVEGYEEATLRIDYDYSKRPESASQELTITRSRKQRIIETSATGKTYSWKVENPSPVKVPVLVEPAEVKVNYQKSEMTEPDSPGLHQFGLILKDALLGKGGAGKIDLPFDVPEASSAHSTRFRVQISNEPRAAVREEQQREFNAAVLKALPESNGVIVIPVGAPGGRQR